jgi:hypothetical protein
LPRARCGALFYPRLTDQVQYLTESYTGYEQLREHGLLNLLQQPCAHGIPLQIEVALLFLVSVAGRLPAVDLHVLLFLV